MSTAPYVVDEQARLSALRRYKILDTTSEEAFDDLVHCAALICRTPISLVSLVDATRQWFKAKVGLAANELPRESAFCAHAILGYDILIVPDTHEDPRFADNPLVVGEPRIRFYAGAPIVTPEGHGLGTLCVIDRVPRVIGQAETRSLRGLAREVMTQLELRRALLKVDERTRELDAFASSVAHDLRAPLRAMRGFAEILGEDYGAALGEEGRKLLERVLHSGGRMDAMIEGLLAFARVAREDLPLVRVELGPVLAEILRDMEPELRARNADVAISPDLPAVRAHPLALRQVFRNLLSNAAKFVPPGVRPRVNVTAEEGVDRVVVSVIDNGVGIDPERRDQLFKPFSRLQLQEDAYPGVGIGLAIVRKNLERMGGRVGVESDAGQGSRFWVDLPLDIPRSC
jgi:signal transduction histidine kinase